MAKYTLVDEIEAHELGVTPEPEWLRTLRADGSVLQEGASYKVGCPYGWAGCYVGDYVIFVAAETEMQLVNDGISGEDEEQEVVVTPKSVDVMTKAQFEALYKPGSPVLAEPAEPDEHS